MEQETTKKLGAEGVATAAELLPGLAGRKQRKAELRSVIAEQQEKIVASEKSADSIFEAMVKDGLYEQHQEAYRFGYQNVNAVRRLVTDPMGPASQEEHEKALENDARYLAAKALSEQIEEAQPDNRRELRQFQLAEILGEAYLGEEYIAFREERQQLSEKSLQHARLVETLFPGKNNQARESKLDWNLYYNGWGDAEQIARLQRYFGHTGRVEEAMGVFENKEIAQRRFAQVDQAIAEELAKANTLFEEGKLESVDVEQVYKTVCAKLELGPTRELFGEFTTRIFPAQKELRIKLREQVADPYLRAFLAKRLSLSETNPHGCDCGKPKCEGQRIVFREEFWDDLGLKQAFGHSRELNKEDSRKGAVHALAELSTRSKEEKNWQDIWEYSSWGSENIYKIGRIFSREIPGYLEAIQAAEAEIKSIEEAANTEDLEIKVKIFRDLIAQRRGIKQDYGSIRAKIHQAKSGKDSATELPAELIAEREAIDSAMKVVESDIAALAEEVKDFLGEAFRLVSEFGVTVDQAKLLQGMSYSDSSRASNGEFNHKGVKDAVAINDSVAAAIFSREDFNGSGGTQWTRQVVAIRDGQIFKTDEWVVRDRFSGSRDRDDMWMNEISKAVLSEDGTKVNIRVDTGQSYRL